MSYTRSDEVFISQGTKCAAWFYQPEGVEKPPVIIMGHGFGAERSFGLPAFAERFVKEGYAVFVFDYRTFGDSEGMPRNNVDPYRHNEDWDAAIAHVQQLDNIDSNQIVLWGSSFGGGHVVCTASRHHDIAAIISQVPFCGVPEDADKPPVKDLLVAMGQILMDKIKMVLTGTPYYIPVVGKPGSTAILKTPECWDGYMKLVPEGSNYTNLVPARILGIMGSYNPTSVADQVQCPALIVAAEHDSLIPVELPKHMAEKIPKGIFKSLNANHFAPYTGDAFEENIGLQIEFLREVLKKP